MKLACARVALLPEGSEGAGGARGAPCAQGDKGAREALAARAVGGGGGVGVGGSMPQGKGGDGWARRGHGLDSVATRRLAIGTDTQHVD